MLGTGVVRALSRGAGPSCSEAADGVRAGANVHCAWPGTPGTVRGTPLHAHTGSEMLMFLHDRWWHCMTWVMPFSAHTLGRIFTTWQQKLQASQG